MQMTPIEAMLEDITRRRNRVEEQLRGLAERIRSSLDSVDLHLDEDYHINGLGELQSRGPDFDRLCGLRQELVEMQNLATYLLEREREQA